MKKILALIILISSFNIYALTKADLKKSLAQMRSSKMFTPEQIDAAEKHLMAMDEAQINALAKKGMEASKDPNIRNKAEEAFEKLQDLEKKQNQKK